MGKIRHQNSEEQNFSFRIFYNCFFKTQEQAIRYENNYRFALNTAKYVNATTEKLSFFFAFKALKQDFHPKKFFKANFPPPPLKIDLVGPLGHGKETLLSPSIYSVVRMDRKICFITIRQKPKGVTSACRVELQN